MVKTDEHRGACPDPSSPRRGCSPGMGWRCPSTCWDWAQHPKGSLWEAEWPPRTCFGQATGPRWGPGQPPTCLPCGSHLQAAKSPPPQGEQTQEPPRGDLTCRGAWPRLPFWLQLPCRGFRKGGPGHGPSSPTLELRGLLRAPETLTTKCRPTGLAEQCKDCTQCGQWPPWGLAYSWHLASATHGYHSRRAPFPLSHTLLLSTSDSRPTGFLL